MTYVGSASRNNLNYIRDRWYVEACNITNDSSGKFQMELTLNPIATSGKDYSEALASFEKAFTDALGSNTNSSSNSSTGVASTGSNTTLKGGQGTTIDNLVKNICGSETDALKKAKAIHEWLKGEVSYKR